MYYIHAIIFGKLSVNETTMDAQPYTEISKYHSNSRAEKFGFITDNKLTLKLYQDNKPKNKASIVILGYLITRQVIGYTAQSFDFNRIENL